MSADDDSYESEFSDDDNFMNAFNEQRNMAASNPASVKTMRIWTMSHENISKRESDNISVTYSWKYPLGHLVNVLKCDIHEKCKHLIKVTVNQDASITIMETGGHTEELRAMTSTGIHPFFSVQVDALLNGVYILMYIFTYMYSSMKLNILDYFFTLPKLTQTIFYLQLMN